MTKRLPQTWQEEKQDPVGARVVALSLNLHGSYSKLAAGTMAHREHEQVDHLDALTELARLDELAADLVDWSVLHARENAASWAEVGEALGMSRQAARQRFGDLRWAPSVTGATKWREPKLPAR